jgi:hypothetical protein
MRFTAMLFLCVVFVLNILACKSSEPRSEKQLLLSDEECRKRLQEGLVTVDPSIQPPLTIRRQEGYEEELSNFAAYASIPFYFFKVSSKKVILTDGRPFESLFAVDRREVRIYALFGKKSDPNAFNSVVSQSHLAIDLPDKALTLADLYLTLTQDPKQMFIHDETELVAHLSDYYDPKHLPVKSARSRALQALSVKSISDLQTRFRPKAALADGGYTVTFASIHAPASEPSVKQINLMVHSNGTISDMDVSTIASLDEGPWCIPSVLDRCELER